MESTPAGMETEETRLQDILAELSEAAGDANAPESGIHNLLPVDKWPRNARGETVSADQLGIPLLQRALDVYRSAQGRRPQLIRAAIRRSVNERGVPFFAATDINGAAEELDLNKKPARANSTGLSTHLSKAGAPSSSEVKSGTKKLIPAETWVLQGLEDNYPRLIERFVPKELRCEDEFGNKENLVVYYDGDFLEALYHILIDYEESFEPEEFHQMFKDRVQRRLTDSNETDRTKFLTTADIILAHKTWNAPKENVDDSNINIWNSNQAAGNNSKGHDVRQPAPTLSNADNLQPPALEEEQTPPNASTSQRNASCAGGIVSNGSSFHAPMSEPTFAAPRTGLEDTQSRSTSQSSKKDGQSFTQPAVPILSAKPLTSETSADIDMPDSGQGSSAVPSTDSVTFGSGIPPNKPAAEPYNIQHEVIGGEDGEKMNGIAHTGQAGVAPKAAQTQANEPWPTDTTMLVDSIQDSSGSSIYPPSSSSRSGTVALRKDDSSERPQSRTGTPNRAENAGDVKMLDVPEDEHGNESSQAAATASVEPDSPIAPKPSKQSTPSSNALSLARSTTPPGSALRHDEFWNAASLYPIANSIENGTSASAITDSAFNEDSRPSECEERNGRKSPLHAHHQTPEDALQHTANGQETKRHDSPLDAGASAEKLQAEQTGTSVDEAYSSIDADMAVEKDLNTHSDYDILADDELYVGDLYEDDVDEINGGNALAIVEPVNHSPARYAFNHVAQTLAAEVLTDNVYQRNGASRRKRFVLYCLPCRRTLVHGASIKIRLNMALYHDMLGERNKRSGPLSLVRRANSRTTYSFGRLSPANPLWQEQTTSVEFLPHSGIQKQKRNNPRVKHLGFKYSGNGCLKLKRRPLVSTGRPKAAIDIPTRTPTEAVTQNGIKSMVEAYVDVLYYTGDGQRIQEANGLIAKYGLDRPLRAEKGHGVTYRHQDGSITGIPMNPAAQYNIFELERNLDTQRVITGYDDDILTPTNDRIDWSIMFLWRLVERAAKELERAVQTHLDWKRQKYGPPSTAPICSFELAYENAPRQPRTSY